MLLSNQADGYTEVDRFENLPAIGINGRIYITIRDDKAYRWNGTSYIKVSDNANQSGFKRGTGSTIGSRIFTDSCCADGVLVDFDEVVVAGSGQNISPAKNNIYMVNFSSETTVPSGNIVFIDPSGYIVNNVKKFKPSCFVKIDSKYLGSQTLIKLDIRDSINENGQSPALLKRLYKKVFCIPDGNQDRFCIVPDPAVPSPTTLTLNFNNNWTRYGDNTVLIKFVPAENLVGNISISMSLADLSLEANNSLPGVSSIIKNTDYYGQLIYNPVIFNNKVINLDFNGVISSGTISTTSNLLSLS